jgi:hypothetical protein
MKFSKSILIFLFFSSLAGAFFYALDRTNGNVFKSLQFTLYFLAIKMGLIGPNIPFKLDHHQPTQQLVSRVNKVELPEYHPYLSVYNDYRPSGLLMDSIERYSLVPQYSYSQNTINELRAGDSRVKEAAWLLITIWMLQQRSVGFQPVRQAPPPPHHQLFGGTSSSLRKNYFSKSSQPSASLQMERPSSIPHQDFTALTKEERRNLPDPRDGFIDLEGHPKLIARYGQVKFKTPDHGKVHGLAVDEKGRTPKTEKNALALRDSILNMPNRKNIIWFDNGMYQGGTDRDYDSVNLFDKETNTIAVFRKDENGEYNRFTTTCTLTKTEREYLFNSSGNFVTDNNLNNPEVFPILKNLTNKETEK